MKGDRGHARGLQFSLPNVLQCKNGVTSSLDQYLFMGQEITCMVTSPSVTHSSAASESPEAHKQASKNRSCLLELKPRHLNKKPALKWGGGGCRRGSPEKKDSKVKCCKITEQGLLGGTKLLSLFSNDIKNKATSDVKRAACVLYNHYQHHK